MQWWIVVFLVAIVACSGKRGTNGSEDVGEIDESADGNNAIDIANAVAQIRSGEVPTCSGRELEAGLRAILEMPRLYLTPIQISMLAETASFLMRTVEGTATGNVPTIGDDGLLAVVAMLVAPWPDKIYAGMSVRKDLRQYVKQFNRGTWHLPQAVRLRMVGCMFIAAGMWSSRKYIRDGRIDVSNMQDAFLNPESTYIEWAIAGNRLPFDCVWLHIYATRALAAAERDPTMFEAQLYVHVGSHAYAAGTDIASRSFAQRRVLVFKDAVFALLQNIDDVGSDFGSVDMDSFILEGRIRRLAMVHRKSYVWSEMVYAGPLLMGELCAENYAEFTMVLNAVAPAFGDEEYARVAIMYADYVAFQRGVSANPSASPMRAHLPTILERQGLSSGRSAVIRRHFGVITSQVAAHLQCNPALAYVSLRIAYEDYWRPLKQQRIMGGAFVSMYALVRMFRERDANADEGAFLGYVMRLANGRAALAFADVFEAVFAKHIGNSIVDAGTAPWWPVPGVEAELRSAAEIFVSSRPSAALLGAIAHVYLSHVAVVHRVRLPDASGPARWAGTLAAAVGRRNDRLDITEALNLFAGIATTGPASIAHIVAAYVAGERYSSQRDDSLSLAIATLDSSPIARVSPVPSDRSIAEERIDNSERRGRRSSGLLSSRDICIAGIVSQTESMSLDNYDESAVDMATDEAPDRMDRETDRQDRETERTDREALPRLTAGQRSTLRQSVVSRLTSIFVRDESPQARPMATAEGEPYVPEEVLSYGEMFVNALLPAVIPLPIDVVVARLEALGTNLQTRIDVAEHLGRFGQPLSRMQVVHILTAYFMATGKRRVPMDELMAAYSAARRSIPRQH